MAELHIPIWTSPTWNGARYQKIYIRKTLFTSFSLLLSTSSIRLISGWQSYLSLCSSPCISSIIFIPKSIKRSWFLQRNVPKNPTVSNQLFLLIWVMRYALRSMLSWAFPVSLPKRLIRLKTVNISGSLKTITACCYNSLTIYSTCPG